VEVNHVTADVADQTGVSRLPESTGNPTADRIVAALTGAFEAAFPGRVRGYYLRGSYATGTAVPGSDLDLFVVFKDRFQEPDEAERADRLRDDCAHASPVLLEAIVVSERRLREPSALALALNLKLATRLVHGDDIRPALPEFDATAYVRAVVHAPYHSYAYPVQRRGAPLTYPLAHIDPSDEFYGYGQWSVPGPDGTPVPSTKLLVGSVCWTATALVALRTGRYVADKRASVELYRDQIGDEWTDLVVRVHQVCRDRWQYRLPDAEPDRGVLRELCDRALDFQNHFLRAYRCYLLGELRSRVPDRQALATRRLCQVQFPDPEVAAALQ
jgi:predicted nucleotidyltransferase